MTRLDIATQVENISLVTSQRVLVNFAIQTALNRVHQAFDWPYYLEPNIVSTVATYTTGTAMVTNGSTVVTGVGTTFTLAMVGRKFRHANENAYYYILSYQSATQITLSTSYQGATDSTGSTYTIYKDEYRLAPDVDKYKKSIQIQNGISFQDVPITTFDTIFPTPQSFSDPNLSMMIGTKLDTYTTGTVSGTISTNTLTGVGTSWTSVEGLGRMSDILVGTNRYTVKSVNSDTQITVYETIVATVATVTYTINLNNLVLMYYPIPSTQQNIYYRSFRVPDVLANDYDVPDMPHSFHWMLVYGALSFVFLQKGDINKAQIESENRFIDGMNMMMKKLGSFSADTIYRRKSIDRYSNRRFSDGLEASNFDIRYSRP